MYWCDAVQCSVSCSSNCSSDRLLVPESIFWCLLLHTSLLPMLLILVSALQRRAGCWWFFGTKHLDFSTSLMTNDHYGVLTYLWRDSGQYISCFPLFYVLTMKIPFSKGWNNFLKALWGTTNYRRVKNNIKLKTSFKNIEPFSVEIRNEIQ